MKNQLKKVVWTLALLSTCLACQTDKELGPNCVQARYLGPSDSPCGGPDQILILKGKEKIYDLFANMREADSLVITTAVPEALRQPGRVLYFTPEKVEPRLCLAIYLWYAEVDMVNASQKGCGAD